MFLLIDLWFFYARATQCCKDLRAEFNCPPENGAECMGLYYCQEMLDELGKVVKIVMMTM